MTKSYWQQYSRKIIIHQSVHCNAIMIGNAAFASDQDSTWFWSPIDNFGHILTSKSYVGYALVQSISINRASLYALYFGTFHAAQDNIIIFSLTNDVSYTSALDVANLPTLAHRREQLSRKFFNSVLHPSSCLHSLLPPATPNYSLAFEPQANFLARLQELRNISLFCLTLFPTTKPKIPNFFS